MKPQEKIQALRTELRSVFYERANVIDGVLTALLAGEHVLLLGPPGTAKSGLASALCEAIEGATHFEWLLTKFSAPEEVFGQMSLKGLEQDRFRRNTVGKLPEAHVAFLDEIFKANSSILNALLTLINERKFHNDGAPSPCPLLTMFGASNELPESKELEALFDRFLLRYWTPYIADRANLRAMLLGGKPSVTTKISLPDLSAAQAEVASVTISDPLIETLLDVKAATEKDGVRASDRRWQWIIHALKAYAYVCGDRVVGEDHFDILPDMLWREPGERPSLVQTVGKIANPMAAKATEILDAAKELFANLPAMSSNNRAEYMAAAADANAQYDEMEREVRKLIDENPGKDRKLKEALATVEDLHGKTQRQAAKNMGIRI